MKTAQPKTETTSLPGGQLSYGCATSCWAGFIYERPTKMKTGCNTCNNSDKCEYKNTPFARDILSRGHGRCSDYEPVKKRKAKK